MKEDIKIPEVTNVLMAVVKEYNEEFQCEDPQKQTTLSYTQR